MDAPVNLLPLIGIALIMVVFVLRFNPALVVIVAGIGTGLAATMPLETIITNLGAGFIKTRTLPIILILPLAIIWLLERNGLKEHAQNWIRKIQSATAGKLMIVYLAVRELSAALGLTSLGGHPQMVRPLLAPMAEGATQNKYGVLPDAVREKLRAMSAATDNVGLFFGEDVFVAFGAIVLMQTFLSTSGIDVDPLHIAMWGIPTALCAFVIHAVRLKRMDNWVAQAMQDTTAQHSTANK